jgi:hypothetical protein
VVSERPSIEPCGANVTSLRRPFYKERYIDVGSPEGIAMRGCCWFAAMGLLIGCGGGSQGESSAVRAAVVSGLVAHTDNVSLQQATTFQVEIQGTWAIAYDPADPPGCTAGGLWGAPDGPAIAASPCTAFVLTRRKARWTVLGSGPPGTFDPPKGAPKLLGDPTKLIYLGG